jgi:hypothetical protein
VCVVPSNTSPFGPFWMPVESALMNAFTGERRVVDRKILERVVRRREDRLLELVARATKIRALRGLRS